MQPCNRIHYSTVHWRLSMFLVAYRSSSGAPTVFAASGLRTHVVTGRSPHAYVNQRLQIKLELLMMRGMLLETCWAFNERWNNKFRYKVASCWLFLLQILHMWTYSNINRNKHMQLSSLTNEYLEHTLKMPTQYMTPQHDILVVVKGINIFHKFCIMITQNKNVFFQQNIFFVCPCSTIRNKSNVKLFI